MFQKIRHWFTPHHTNNYRARLLHNFGLSIIIAAFLLFNAATRILEISPLQILGFTSTVTVQEIITQTNEQRVTYGQKPLNISAQLSQAAAKKAQHMLSNDYWAHTAPSGETPWDFIVQAGYNYTRAGENLAKDFTNTPRVIQAWIESPTHRANITSDQYSEIGVAVVHGNLNGQDTVLIVQMFGTTTAGQITSQSTTKEPETPQIAELKVPGDIITSKDGNPISNTILSQKQASRQPKINVFDVRKTVSIATSLLLLLVLLTDLIIAESKKISRRVGKNWAHLLFINIILIAITMINAGHIL